MEKPIGWEIYIGEVKLNTNECKRLIITDEDYRKTLEFMLPMSIEIYEKYTEYLKTQNEAIR